MERWKAVKAGLMLEKDVRKMEVRQERPRGVITCHFETGLDS